MAENKDYHPMDNVLRMDRIPHIWCPSCGIGVAVSALAVHGVMSGALDREQRYRLNHFDLLVPDGQPVRWALKWLRIASWAPFLRVTS